MKQLFASILALMILLSFSTASVYAQKQGPTIGGSQPTTLNGQTSTNNIKIQNPLKGDGTITGLLTAILNNIILPIGGILAVLSFIYSGFLYVMARGDETQIATAHRALLYSAIGTVVLLGAKVIADLLTATVNQLRT